MLDRAAERPAALQPLILHIQTKMKRRITPLLVSPSTSDAVPAGQAQRSMVPAMSIKEMSEYTERNIGPGRRLYVALQEPGATVSWSKVSSPQACENEGNRQGSSCGQLKVSFESPDPCDDSHVTSDAAGGGAAKASGN